MSPEMSKFLIEGGEVINTNNTHLENLMQYLDENLCTLNDELNEENFQRILDIMVDQIATIMFNLIQNNLEVKIITYRCSLTVNNNNLLIFVISQKKKSPSYFRNLRDSFHMLFGFLRKGNETEYTSETIQKLEALLHLHTLDTTDLIHEYYLERLCGQKEMQEATEGILTVKLIFINDVLKVDILNANNIKAMDTNGTANI